MTHDQDEKGITKNMKRRYKYHLSQK